MRHTYNRWLTAAIAAVLIGSGAPCASAADGAWSIGTDNLITVTGSPLDIELVYENISHVSPSVVDLTKMDDEMDGQHLREMIAAYTLPTGDLYSRGERVTDEAKQHLLDNRNLAPIGKTQHIGYGVAVRRANVKALPVGSGLFAAQDDTERDLLQEGALDPCEPVRLLHVSADRRYYFVQSRTVCGWAFIGDIAACKQSEWQTFAEPLSYLTVISRGQRIKQAAETVYAQMGTRIPLKSQNDKQYKVIMPIRSGSGKMHTVETTIDKTDSFCVGHLEYTADNIAKLADAYIGAPYGYKGLKNSEDNCGIITDIYRAVGITLPRKSDEMLAAAKHLPPCGDITIIPAADGTCLLTVARDGTTRTVIGQTEGGAQIGTYTIADAGDAK